MPRRPSASTGTIRIGPTVVGAPTSRNLNADGGAIEPGVVIDDLACGWIRSVRGEPRRVGPRDLGQRQAKVDGGLREQAGRDEQGNRPVGVGVVGFRAIGSRPDAGLGIERGVDRRSGRVEIADRVPVVPDLRDHRAVERGDGRTQGERQRRGRGEAPCGANLRSVGERDRQDGSRQGAEADARRHDDRKIDRQGVAVDDEQVARSEQEDEHCDSGPERGQSDEHGPRSPADEHDDAQARQQQHRQIRRQVTPDKPQGRPARLRGSDRGTDAGHLERVESIPAQEEVAGGTKRDGEQGEQDEPGGTRRRAAPARSC